MIRCCYGCVAPERYPGCHDHCPKYAEDKARHDAEKAEIDRLKYIEAGLTAQTLAGVNRARKAMRRMKRR